MKSKTVIKTLIGIIVIGGGIGYFMYQAMQSSWSYYYSVDEFSATSVNLKNNSFRIAGKVKPGTISRDIKQMKLNFELAGESTGVPVEFGGTVPDNFEDDREVVVEGRLDTNGVFQADTLMTKCESKYEAKVN